MNWYELFGQDKMPSFKDIEQYIGEISPAWTELLSYIEKAYQVEPKMSYSKCSAQPGWNVKFQKSGKSLCTLYPMEGYFIALVVVGVKEEAEVGLAIETFAQYTKDLYSKTSFACGGRWLMIEVKNSTILNDVKSLISIRVKPKIKI